MIIIGHPWVESQPFHKVFSLEDIKQSNATDILLLEPLATSIELAKYCQKNAVAYAVTAGTLNEAVFANALGVNYIVCEEDDAVMIQPIAQEYLFDTRILVLVHEEKELAKIARSGIDGVIFAEAIS